MRRAVLSLFLCALLAPATAVAAKQPPAAPATAPEGGPVLPDARAWVLIDARDGTVLAGKRSHRKLPIASTTKLMTAYVALQRLKLKQKIAAPKYNQTDAESLLGLRVGEKLSVRDLMYALILESANDAAETLADGVSGSVPAFVEEMNRTAEGLGLTETHYSTPVGLDTPGNYSSARDLTTLAAKLLEIPFFAKVADSTSAKLKTGDHPRTIGTRVLLLNSYPFVTGVKTGHTLDAGYVLVGAGEKNGTTLISAVLHAPSEGARDADTLKLLQYGFGLFKSSTPVKQGQPYDGPDLDFGRGSLSLQAQDEIKVSSRPGQKVDTEVEVPGEIKGAVAEGQKVGEVRVTVDGRAAGASPLVASESVGAAGVFRKGVSALSGPLALIPLGLIVIVAGLLVAGGHRPRAPKLAGPSWTPGPSGGDGDPAGPGGNGASPSPGGSVTPRRRAGASTRPLPADAGSQPRPTGRSAKPKGEEAPARGRSKRAKSSRTPEDRERMRKERMERRSRQRPKGDGE